MQQKHIPERSSIVCRKKGDKSLFIKLVLNKNGDIFIEKDKNLDGRGAYICKDESCIKICKTKKSLNRVFKQNIKDDVYEELLNEFTNK